MSNYIKTTNFLAKDALPAGDSNKKIRGAEFNVEFDNIQTAVNSKSDSNNGAHTGTSTFENLTSSGVSTFANLVATTANIDGGTIDGTSIGGTSASSGSFTTLASSGLATLNSLSTASATITGGSVDNTPIGGTTRSSGAFTTLTASGATTLAGLTSTGITNSPISGSTGSFTTLSASGSTTLATLSATNVSYTGTLTGGTGIINIGSGQIYKDASGNVGIGTSASYSKLYLKQLGNASITTGFVVENSTNDNRLGMYFDGPADEWRVIASFGTTGAFKPLTFYTSDLKRLTIDTAGNLGLGVTPSAWNTAGKAVEVGFLGNALYSTGVNTLYNLSNAYLNQAGNFIYASTGSATRFQHQAGSFQFFTAPSGTAGNAITFTEAARITSGGYFKASNTGSYVGSASPYHELRNNANDVVLLASSTNTGSAVATYYSDLPSGATGLHADYITANAQVYRVLANGNVQNTNNSYGALSDAKLKENVISATPKLDDLMKVEFVNFNFINDPDKRKQFGVIAQQLETVFPGLVESTPDTEEVEVTDDEGNVFKERRETGTFTKSVNYSVLALMACKALQEANAKIELLTERIVALENK